MKFTYVCAPMRKLSNRFFLSLGLITLAATFLAANTSTEIDFASLTGKKPASSLVIAHQHTFSVTSKESDHAKKDQKKEGTVEVYEEQDSDDKSTSKRFSQFGQLFILISFALALILIYRKGRHQLHWLAHSLDSFPKWYILFRVFRIWSDPTSKTTGE